MRPERQAFLDFEREAYNAVSAGYATWAADKTPQVLPYLFKATGDLTGKTVVDLATGPGFSAAAASEKGGHVTGVDLAPQMIDLARKAYPNIEFRVAPAEDLPFGDNTIDVVMSSFGLPHFAEHSLVFSECHRVLRPDGHLAMSTWAPPDRNPFIRLAMGGVIAHGDPTAGNLPQGENMFAHSDLQRCKDDLERCGFHDVTIAEAELTFAIDGADAITDFLATAGSRTKAMFNSQTPQARTAIRSFIEEQIAPYAQPNGPHQVPALAIIVAARTVPR